MSQSAILNEGILNNYVKKPQSLTEYTLYRGVTDFTQIGQFDQFETGYSFLSVIQVPKFLEIAASMTSTSTGQLVKQMITSFVHMLEYEFRGLDGLPDITADSVTITNGVQEINMINKVNEDSSVNITSAYFEKSGSLITKFCEWYLTGIKDKRSEAKTYHGLIAQGALLGNYQNEVFTLLYYVTDNTYLQLERAFLLTNVQITKAETSMYNSQRGEISNKEMTIEMNAFPITGNQVDKAAKKMLTAITGVNVTTKENGEVKLSVNENIQNPAVLDSSNYEYDAIGQIDAAYKKAIGET